MGNNVGGLSQDFDWEKAARNLLENEKRIRPYMRPEPIRIMVKCRNGCYFGHIQEIVPEYSKEIVALSKTSNPLPDDFASAIRRLDPCRLELIVDDSIELEGRQHVLRRLEKRLTIMTPEQTEYMIQHPPEIYELNM